jgi:regulator of protease activity HflC (stomatin/prohibitin superfamily)
VSGLAWFNDLMVWLGRWFPRLVLIRAKHTGVKFGLRGVVTELEPGLHMYWPITTEVKVVSRTVRTLEIASMLCGYEVISLVVQYRIDEPKQLMMKFYDIFSYVDDMTQSCLSASYLPELENSQIEKTVASGLSGLLEPIVSIHGVWVISRGKVIALKNLTDWAVHAKSEF